MFDLVKVVDGDMLTVEASIRAALAARGFGILTEIDVAATLKAKLDVDRAPMKILGACNPSFANQALEHDASVALLMPCNVVLEQHDNRIKVTAMDPSKIMDDPELKTMTMEATKLLSEAVQSL
ncbi:MAG: DUF302 domain-containing protein [Ferrimicrobium sp.]